MTRDSQRQKVYNWEDKNIHHRPNQKSLKFSEAQDYVNFIWSDMGLVNPPKVIPFHAGVTKWLGMADRMEVHLHKDKQTTQAVILHELAHSMTTGATNLSHFHDARFVGMYMELLIKYLNLDRFFLWFSAEKEKVQFEKFAKPAIVNSDCTAYDD